MSVLAKWNLGGKALAVASWAADVARSIDPAAAFAVLMKVVEIEQTQRGTPGAIKLTGLLNWFSTNYPNAGGVTVVIGYVKAIVDLLNAVGVFRK